MSRRLVKIHARLTTDCADSGSSSAQSSLYFSSRFLDAWDFGQCLLFSPIVGVDPGPWTIRCWACKKGEEVVNAGRSEAPPPHD